METVIDNKFISDSVNEMSNGTNGSTAIAAETLNKKRSMEEDDDDLPPPLVEFNDAVSKRIPVSILTGFLGSGKILPK
jgi:hypothetical protein